MSDGKEVKRWKFFRPDYSVVSGLAVFADNLPIGESEFISVPDHLAAMAEKDEKIVRMTSDLVDCDRRIAELRAEVEALKSSGMKEHLRKQLVEKQETIARQAEVIEKLKANVAHDEECASFDEYKCDCWRNSFFETVEAELAAIENGKAE